ncbi:MAG: hypothetical protein IIC78_02920 [Chloroflexi bacterium]|nr:hypothetical protein [Chloroflexota bacterium]
MDWSTIILLALVLASLGILWPRIEKHLRPRFALILYLPTIVFILRWSKFRDAWNMLLMAILIAVALFLIWWFGYGRNLPPPTGSTIIVITEDDEEWPEQ